MSILTLLVCLFNVVNAPPSFFPTCRVWGVEMLWHNLPFEYRSREGNITLCQKKCQMRKYDGCAFYTFYSNTTNQDNCFLKTEKSTSICRIDNKLVISGSVDAEDCGENFEAIKEYHIRNQGYCLCLEFEIFCYGNIEKIHENIVSPAQCYSLCFNNPGCIFYYMDSFVCILYRSIDRSSCRKRTKGIIGSISCELKDDNKLLEIYRLYGSFYERFFYSEGFIIILSVQGISILYAICVYYNAQQRAQIRKLKTSEYFSIIIDILISTSVYATLDANLIFFLSRPQILSPIPLILSIVKTVVHIVFNAASCIFFIILKRGAIIQASNKGAIFIMILITVINGTNVARIGPVVRSYDISDTVIFYNFSYIKAVIFIILSIFIRLNQVTDRIVIAYLPIILESLLFLVNIINTMTLKNVGGIVRRVWNPTYFDYNSPVDERRYNERIERFSPNINAAPIGNVRELSHN